MCVCVCARVCGRVGGGGFLALSYFLTLRDAPGSSCLFPAPVLQSVISPKSLGPFYWRIVLEMVLGKIAVSITAIRVLKNLLQ